MSASPHARLLSALLPPESYDPAGPKIALALEADGLTLDRVEANALKLPQGLNPLKYHEWLEDYERVYALPGPCLSGVRTLDQRLMELSFALLERMGVSRAFFISLGAMWGYEILIQEYRPFTPGSRAGEAISNGAWRYAWMIQVRRGSLKKFRAGRSSAGEPLSAWGDKTMECLFSRLAPAHTKLLFSYLF